MSALSLLARLAAGTALPRALLPDLSWPDFAGALLDGVGHGLRVAAFFSSLVAVPVSYAISRMLLLGHLRP